MGQYTILDAEALAKGGLISRPRLQYPSPGTRSVPTEEQVRVRPFRRWLDPNWYRYLAAQHPDRLAVTVVLLLALVAFGGYSAVGAMGTGGPPAGRYLALVTTVAKQVRTTENGRVVIRRVLSVKKVYLRASTVVETSTVQTPAGTRIVTRPVVSYRPVYRKKVVIVHGKPVTVRSAVTDTRMLTETQIGTVTNERTNTVVQTQTVSQTATATVTRTQTGPTQTVTVTSPGSTVTVTQTEHVTSTVTVTPGVTVPTP